MPILPYLAQVVTMFKIPGGLDVERVTAQGLDSKGEQLPDARVTIHFDPISVQPQTGSTKSLQPGGTRNSETIEVYTTQEMRTSTGGTTSNGDIILYPPVRGGPCFPYRVQTTEPWDQQSGHFRTFATREEQQ